jgi:hypothetical protein
MAHNDFELGYVGDQITQRDIFETDPGSETQGIGSLPDDFELGYVGDPITQRDIFETRPVVNDYVPPPPPLPDYDYSNMDWNDVGDRGFLFSDAVAPEGFEEIYGAVERDPFRGDWNEADLRIPEGYTGKVLTDDERSSYENADTFFKRLDDAAKVDHESVNAYLDALRVYDVSMYDQLIQMINKFGPVRDEFKDIYEYEGALRSAQFLGDQDPISQEDFETYTQNFIAAAYQAGVINEEQYTYLGNNPEAARELINLATGGGGTGILNQPGPTDIQVIDGQRVTIANGIATPYLDPEVIKFDDKYWRDINGDIVEVDPRTSQPFVVPTTPTPTPTPTTTPTTTTTPTNQPTQLTLPGGAVLTLPTHIEAVTDATNVSDAADSAADQAAADAAAAAAAAANGSGTQAAADAAAAAQVIADDAAAAAAQASADADAAAAQAQADADAAAAADLAAAGGNFVDGSLTNNGVITLNDALDSAGIPQEVYSSGSTYTVNVALDLDQFGVEGEDVLNHVLNEFSFSPGLVFDTDLKFWNAGKNEFEELTQLEADIMNGTADGNIGQIQNRLRELVEEENSLYALDLGFDFDRSDERFLQVHHGDDGGTGGLEDHFYGAGWSSNRSHRPALGGRGQTTWTWNEGENPYVDTPGFHQDSYVYDLMDHLFETRDLATHGTNVAGYLIPDWHAPADATDALSHAMGLNSSNREAMFNTPLAQTQPGLAYTEEMESLVIEQLPLYLEAVGLTFQDVIDSAYSSGDESGRGDDHVDGRFDFEAFIEGSIPSAAEIQAAIDDPEMTELTTWDGIANEYLTAAGPAALNIYGIQSDRTKEWFDYNELYFFRAIAPLMYEIDMNNHRIEQLGYQTVDVTNANAWVENLMSLNPSLTLDQATSAYITYYSTAQSDAAAGEVPYFEEMFETDYPNVDGNYAGGPVTKYAEGGWTGGINDIAPVGGGYVSGNTGGMADEIPAITDGTSPAALSSGEFVVPADVVSHLGDGNNRNGATKLLDMMGQIRQFKTGNIEQPAPITEEFTFPF